MATIINLRQARKKKLRKDKDRAADENRLAHGRSTADKKHVQMKNALDESRIEAHRREPPAEDGKS